MTEYKPHIVLWRGKWVLDRRPGKPAGHTPFTDAIDYVKARNEAEGRA